MIDMAERALPAAFSPSDHNRRSPWSALLLGVIPPHLFRVLGLPLTDVDVPTHDGSMNLVNLWVLSGMPAIIWPNALEQRGILRV